MGAEVVAVTSNESRVSAARLYTDHVIVICEGRFDALVRDRGLQPHVVLDLTAKHTPTDRLRTLRKGGSVVTVGHLENGAVDVLPGAFIAREIRLLASKACTR